MAFVERLNKSECMDCRSKTKDCCREVATVDRWPLVEVRLYC